MLKPGKLYINHFIKYNQDPWIRKIGFTAYLSDDKIDNFSIKEDGLIMVIEIIENFEDSKLKFVTYKILAEDKVGYINIYDGLEKDWSEASFA